MIDAVAELNQMQNAAVDDPEIATRIGQYELAFKMQTSVPALMDMKDEPAKVLELYGTKGPDGSFAAQLPARPPARRRRACGSSSSTTATGTTTAASRTASS